MPVLIIEVGSFICP